jgi:hypothetical protein
VAPDSTSWLAGTSLATPLRGEEEEAIKKKENLSCVLTLMGKELSKQ